MTAQPVAKMPRRWHSTAYIALLDTMATNAEAGRFPVCRGSDAWLSEDAEAPEQPGKSVTSVTTVTPSAPAVTPVTDVTDSGRACRVCEQQLHPAVIADGFDTCPGCEAAR